MAYSLAAQFLERVERVVLCGSGVSMEDKDMEEGLFKVGSVDEAVELLFPMSHDKVKSMLKLVFHKPPRAMPSCVVQDFIDVSIQILKNKGGHRNYFHTKREDFTRQ